MADDLALSWNMGHQLRLTMSDHGHGRVYNPHYVLYGVEVRGPLDLDRVSAAWSALQRRHVALRSGFDLESFRLLGEPAPPALVQVLRTDPDAGEPASATADLNAVLRAPFDLTRGPLARLAVLPLDSGRALLGIAVEHVVTDGWSLRQLIHEFWALYADAGAKLPTPRTSLAEHVRGENEWLDSPAGRRMVADRARHLAELGPLPELSLAGITLTEGPPRLAETREVHFTLDAERTEALRGLGLPLGLSVGSLTQAAFSAALAILSDRSRIGVVLSTANRARPDVRHTVGWLSNKIVVPVQLRHAPSSAEFLVDFAEELATALDNAEIPFAKMLHAMDPSLFGAPTTYPWVGFNPTPASMDRYFPVEIPAELSVESIPVIGGWNDKSLVGYAALNEGELTGSVAYKPCWYDEKYVRMICEEMDTIFHAWTSGKV